MSGGPFSASIKNRNALMPRGNFLLSSHKGKQKEPRSSPRPPARPCGSSKQRATTQPVRRAFPNSLCLCSKRILTGVSNTWKGSFLPSGQNPLTSPRRQMLQMLPWLPLAFCAAFRCSLRWRFTTRLFVHVFLPFGFFDKLCFKHFV